MWAIIFSCTLYQFFEVNTELKQLDPAHIDENFITPFRKNSRDYNLPVRSNDDSRRLLIISMVFYTIKKILLKPRAKKDLLWIFSVLAFILSAIIDNLTATIVLVTILQKVVLNRDTRLWFAGLIIVAANAGVSMVSNWRRNYNHVVDWQ